LCAAIEGMQLLIKKPHAEVQEEKKRRVEFPGHKKVKAAIERHLEIVYTIVWMAAFHVRMAKQSIRRHAAGAKDPAQFHQNWQHLRPEHPFHQERHLRHQVTLTEMKVMKWKVCHPGVCIYILHIPKPNFSIIMHQRRIASSIKILFLIC